MDTAERSIPELELRFVCTKCGEEKAASEFYRCTRESVAIGCHARHAKPQSALLLLVLNRHVSFFCMSCGKYNQQACFVENLGRMDGMPFHAMHVRRKGLNLS